MLKRASGESKSGLDSGRGNDADAVATEDIVADGETTVVDEIDGNGAVGVAETECVVDIVEADVPEEG